MHLFASSAELWLASGDLNKAQEFADQCLDIARRTTSWKYLVKGWHLTGEIALARRQWAEAEHWLRRALQLVQEIGNPPQLWKTHVALGRLHTETRKPEPAQAAYRAARAVIDQVKIRVQPPALRASLEHSPVIQQVYDLNTAS